MHEYKIYKKYIIKKYRKHFCGKINMSPITIFDRDKNILTHQQAKNRLYRYSDGFIDHIFGSYGIKNEKLRKESYAHTKSAKYGL